MVALIGVTMSRHLGPVLLREGTAHRLVRKSFSPTAAPGRINEAALQRLVHEQPDVIPMSEIEPAFGDMVSLCTELPLKTGFLDNLWMTPYGGIVLGECKLFRNPQARREVVAQALDYARALQEIDYEDFQRAIASARGEAEFNLWEFMQESAGRYLEDLPGEAEFIDGVTRRLRDGRVMVLVIGDGIHEGVEGLADYLQLHAGIHANLALVDLSLWELDGALLVIPRLPLKTAIVVRGVVQIAGTDKSIRINGSTQVDELLAQPQRARSGSEDEFFAMMQRSSASSLPIVRQLIDVLTPLGVLCRFSPQYILFEIAFSGRNRTLFDVKFNGEIWGGNILVGDTPPERVSVIEPLLKRLADALDGRLEFTPQMYHRLKSADGRHARVDLFAGQLDDVADIARQAVAAAAE